jgi:uncharacterized protein (TIGR03545 family)
MRWWLRWHWLLPRAAFFVVALLGVSYLLGVAARSAAMRWGEQIFGSPVNVGHAKVPVGCGHVELSGVTIGDRSQPGAVRLTADFCELDVAWRQLLSGQLIVDRGRVCGLRFAGASERRDGTEPALKKSPEPMFADNLDDAASTWLASLDERFESGIVQQFESMKCTHRLRCQWETELASLDKRATALKDRAEALQQATDAAAANQLRHASVVQDMPNQMAALRQDFEAIGREFEALPQRFENERRAIVGARRHDEAVLRKRLKVEPISPEALTAYFLREQVASSVAELVDLVRGMRVFTEPKRNSPKSPAVVIRSLEFRGIHPLLNQDVEVVGLLTGFTTQPGANVEPMRLRMKTLGAIPLQIRATLHGTGRRAAHDEFYVDCREAPLPEVTLGRSDELQLKLTPSVGSLTVSLRIDGNQLTGDVQLVQQQLRITPITGGKLSDVPLATPLRAALGEVNSLATHFTLGGTVDEPQCALWSNLGPAAAEAMERALKRGGEEHAAVVLAESRRHVDERLAAVERQISDEQQRFAVATNNLPQWLDAIARQQTRRERLSVERLGRQLPNNSLFR